MKVDEFVQCLVKQCYMKAWGNGGIVPCGPNTVTP
jgi:hypothetical protein